MTVTNGCNELEIFICVQGGQVGLVEIVISLCAPHCRLISACGRGIATGATRREKRRVLGTREPLCGVPVYQAAGSAAPCVLSFGEHEIASKDGICILDRRTNRHLHSSIFKRHVVIAPKVVHT